MNFSIHFHSRKTCPFHLSTRMDGANLSEKYIKRLVFAPQHNIYTYKQFKKIPQLVNYNNFRIRHRNRKRIMLMLKMGNNLYSFMHNNKILALLHFCLQNERKLIAILFYFLFKRVSTSSFRKISGTLVETS